ncbi:MAG: hypothetical protein KJ950_01560 [Proteobacteria bacterium]|nr:hypothetical protein [Pseudomonadota bacterium]MBU1685721.1 hypothetical protein [Pseudomonadota bacterium]
MTRFFGLPILLAVVAGIIFPYAALSLMPYGFVFLFILMLLSGLSIDWSRLPAAFKRPGELLGGVFLIFAFFPLLQLVVARLLIDDAQFLTGIVFGSLMPVALVAPFFTRELGGDEEYAFLLLVCSMLVSPLIAPICLSFLTADILPIRMVPFMKNMVLLVTIPLAASYLVARLMPGLRLRIVPYLAVGNMAALSVLIFILFGNAVGRINLGYESWPEISRLLLLAFFQDFGVLLLARALVGRIISEGAATALMVSLSMKNVAIATGILLFYDPRAALPPALVFIAHACLFSFLPLAKRFLVIKGEEPVA